MGSHSGFKKLPSSEEDYKFYIQGNKINEWMPASKVQHQALYNFLKNSVNTYKERNYTYEINYSQWGLYLLLMTNLSTETTRYVTYSVIDKYEHFGLGALTDNQF